MVNHNNRTTVKASNVQAGWRTRPFVGEWLMFNNLVGGRYDRTHQFYDNFPSGRRVGPNIAYVDMHYGIQVEEVREATGHDRYGSFSYVSVRFTATNGTVLWTAVRRGDSYLMRSARPRDVRRRGSYLD